MNRNWPEICKVGKEGNHLLMALLASVNLTTEVGKRLVAAFPECFGEFTRGPIPLSFLIAKEREDGGNAEFGLCCDWVDEHIPRLEFSNEPPQFRYLATKEGVVLPDDVAKKARFRDVIEFDGKKWFVLYSSTDSKFEEQHVDLVPEGLIATDL